MENRGNSNLLTGYIILDEIGEMQYHLQAKLLRAIETKNIIRVGGSKPIKIDVRIIAATNKDLKAMIKKGQFRQDLYYRLKVLTLDIPPLNQRGERYTGTGGLFS